MARLDIAHSEEAAHHLETQWNGVEHLLLGVFGGVVTWADVDVGSNSWSACNYRAYRNAHEFAKILGTYVYDFAEALACFTALVRHSSMCMLSLLSPCYFTEGVHVCIVEDQFRNAPRAIVMNTNVEFLDQVGTVECNFIVAKYLSGKIALNHSVLKFSGDSMPGIFLALKSIAHSK